MSEPPCKKSRLEPRSVLIFADGSFQRVPSEVVAPQQKKQMATVFAADGRYIHVERSWPPVAWPEESTSCEMEDPKQSKSWLDSRLEHAPVAACPIVISKPQLEPETANLLLELHVKQQCPGGSSQSAARLQIKAPSAEALDKVLSESVGSLLSSLKPVT